MARNVWGFWDCKYCGSKHIRGDNNECPGCGHSRDADVKFYVDTENLVEVSADKKNDKANWICSFCGSQNNAYDQFCASCGASKNDASGDYFHRNTAPVGVPSSGSSAAAKKKSPFFIAAMIVIPLAIVIAIIAGISAFVKWFDTPLEKQFTVTGVSWTRSIDIEELQTRSDSGWTLPNGARLSYSRTEIRSYTPVLDHYETRTREVSTQSITGYDEVIVGYDDLGNGQFMEVTSLVPEYTTVYSTETYQAPVYRDEPVYDTKYYYEIDSWKKSRSVDTSGSDKNPYWGEVVLGSKERQSEKHESYYISGIVDEKTRRYSLKFSDWSRFNAGDTVEITIRQGDGEIISIGGAAVNAG